MQRGDYLFRKFITALLTLAVVIVFNFFLFRILPGDPARAIIGRGRMKPQTAERIKEQFGLDKPIWFNLDKLQEGDVWGATDSQFTAYVRNLFQGNLGVSFSNRLEVSEILTDRIWKTVVLLLTGEVVAILLGSILGIIASWRRGSKLDVGILIWGLFTWSIPTFFFGIILVILARGFLPTGMMVEVGLKPGDGITYWLNVGKHLILPTITLGIGFTSTYMMVMRSSVVEVLSEDYILTAKAKGLNNFQILRDHALKNAMLPMVTLLTLSLAYTVGGAIQVETVFSWPGIGRLIFDSVGKQDYPVLQGAFLLIAVSVISANFLADLLYTMLDPRVELDSPASGTESNIVRTFLHMPKSLLALVVFVLSIPIAIWNALRKMPKFVTAFLVWLGRFPTALMRLLRNIWRLVKTAWKTFKRKPMALFGLGMLVFVIFMAVFAPLLVPFSQEELATIQVTSEDILAPPDADHFLGTDDAGKDVLSQLIYGARISLIVGFSASFMSLIIGSVVGMMAGYFGGRTDTLLMRLVDFLMVIPTLPLMLVIITFWGRGLDKIILVIGLLYWTYMARLVRSQVISIKERHYVLRAKALGASDFRIVFRHIFPQVVPLIIAQGVLDTSTAIIAESSLAFLGLGDPTQVSWGMMLNFAFARAISSEAWWFLLPPGFSIVWVSLSLILIGTALEEIFNPRLKTHHLFNARKMLSKFKATKPPSPESSRSPTIFEVNDLSVCYLTEEQVVLKAVEDVSFSLEVGRSIGIVGESGCGKTTVMLALMRLLPEAGRITQGQIVLNEQDLLHLGETEMCGVRWVDISMVFQGAMNAFNPVRTVENQVIEALLHHGIKDSKSTARIRARELLDMVGISPEFGKQYPHQYSGGMRQRAIIAMALACEPQILIADEPTTALDVMIQAQIIQLIQKLQKELNLTLILVTHDLGVVAEICDDVLVMYAGEVVEYGSCDDIYNQAEHPYTQRLLQAFPDVENPDMELISIPGAPPRLDDLPQGCRFAPRCHLHGEKCSPDAPPSYEVASGHWVACHLVRKL